LAQRQHAIVRGARPALRGVGIAGRVVDGVCVAAGEEDEITRMQGQALTARFHHAGACQHQMKRHLPIRLRVMRNRERPLEQAAQVEAGLRPRELDELAQGIH
jgi:hypothetical protein